ncbi:MAG: NAD(P)/FAD-dependent oxidoreductase [Candidatus Gastranaerophilales bacterium]|nr:NAD(P)/FAD-dependent oxidoreductase [Candidatus Gastranaerophilales bacterium]
MEKNKTQVIVIGAGPAGVCAAITLARADKEVILIERGDLAGDKNIFGGAIYYNQTKDIFPDFESNAPIERVITQQRIFMLSDNETMQFSYNYNDLNRAYTVNRSKWDRWCVEEAKKAGVYFAPKTLVKELIVKENKVIGIKTDKEEYYADITIIADGVNSLLAKQIGLRKDLKDSDVTLNVKEMIKLPVQTLQDRFNTDDTTGIAAKILGGALKDMFALGFMYTYKDTVSIGFGVSLDELKNSGLTPYELLDKLKQHQGIAPFIKGGETVEYSAHMIPEGTYSSLPEVYSDGVLLAGDAAMFVNNIHMEGTNLAMLSGKLAAETAIEAINKNDFSSKTLKLYFDKLKKSIIFKDLKTHNNTIKVIKRNIKTLTSLYPKLACSFFNLLTNADGVPKSDKYRDFAVQIIKSGAIFSTIPLIFFAIGKCIKK